MMNVKHPIYSINWLTDRQNAYAISPRLDFENLPFPLAPEVGSGSLEMHQLMFGMIMFRGVCQFEKESMGQLVPLLEFDSTYEQDSFCVQTQCVGITNHHEFYPENHLIFQPGYDLFRHAKRAKCQVFLDGSQDNDMISMQVYCSVLEMFIGEENAQTLLDKLTLKNSPTVVVKAIPHHISAVLQSALTHTLTGDARKLFAQAKVLEYFGRLLTHTLVESPDTTMQDSRDSAHAVQTYLINLDGKLPTLDTLAKKFNMPVRRLNQAFSMEFGEGIYAYITSYRLERAHDALMQTDTPMKILSANLGYSHVNHFITAFKKKFGYSPGVLRKSRKANM